MSLVLSNDIGTPKVSLTFQVDGITDTFDLGLEFDSLDVYFGGRLIEDDCYTISGNTFTLDFVPKLRSGVSLIAFYKYN